MFNRKSQVIRQPSTGFTLVELLIVIGIIGLLIGLLLPAVNKIRIASQKVATQGTINRISAACEAYMQTQAAYPGIYQNRYLQGSVDSPDTLPSIVVAPATTPAVPNAFPITSTENMVLSLLGGLQIRAGVTPVGTPTYDKSFVGGGANSLNTNKPGKFQPFLEVKSNELTLSYANPEFSGGAQGQWLANDSVIPEVLDNFANPHPILYIRANKGNSLIFTNSTPASADCQYDVRQLYPYGFPGSMDADYLKAYPADTSAGLAAGDGSYFGNHELTRGAANVFVAKQKDAYILISAGPDGKYGTADDIRN